MKQRQCCNKFSKDFKTMVHIKKKKSLQTSQSVPSTRGEVSLPQVQNHCVEIFTVSVPFLPPHANWDMPLGPSSDWRSCLRGSDFYCHGFSESYSLHVMSQGLLVLRGLSPYLHLTKSYCVCWLQDIPEMSKTQSSLPNWNRGYSLVNHSQIWPRRCFPYVVKYLLKN